MASLRTDNGLPVTSAAQVSTPIQSPKPNPMKKATPPPRVPALRLQPSQAADKASPLRRISMNQDQEADSGKEQSAETMLIERPARSRPTSSHSSVSAEDAGTLKCSRKVHLGAECIPEAVQSWK